MFFYSLFFCWDIVIQIMYHWTAFKNPVAIFDIFVVSAHPRYRGKWGAVKAAIRGGVECWWIVWGGLKRGLDVRSYRWERAKALREKMGLKEEVDEISRRLRGSEFLKKKKKLPAMEESLNPGAVSELFSEQMTRTNDQWSKSRVR